MKAVIKSVYADVNFLEIEHMNFSEWGIIDASCGRDLQTRLSDNSYCILF